MSSLDSLPGDQRAVLELVLRQDRGYDEIERLLSVDRTAVRSRALSALDAIGPATSVEAHRRALIADYLLGQLPRRVSEDVAKRLGQSEDERNWAQALISELAPIASKPLPAVPSAAVNGDAPADQTDAPPSPSHSEAAGLPSERPASRRGGAILLVIGALVAIAVVVFLLTQGGSKRNGAPPTPAASSPTAPAASSPTTPPSTSTTPATPSTSTTPPKILAQVNLLPPSGKSKAKGAAELLTEKGTLAVLLVASGLAPNTKHDVYAVWLYNSPAKYVRVGFVTPGVGSNGKVERLGLLPANAASYSKLLLTLEPQPPPAHPGNVMLAGGFKIR
ncbi:MAG: sigma-70 region 4 domain-containing protein [Actinomycetota bacterium]|nr:sigma-70 region 4 domain-containing protein [Actinomycetota bacterium]